jgi:aminopeptidase N
MKRRLTVALFAFAFLLAAKQRSVRPPETAPLDQPLHDRFSFSQPLRVTTHHLSLDLTVDFATQTMRGTAVLDIENLSGTRQLILDSERLTISRVTLDDGQPATWTRQSDDIFGAPLTIDIEPSTTRVTIDYTTDPRASGLFWNSAEQSYGRVQPYLYSLNEPVGARSWIPIQDTPSMRLTYDATVHVPSTHLALMTAGNNPHATNATGIYHFTMAQPIPPYLIAIAVGRLDYHAFDERTGVYAEPELMDAAISELGYLPQMVAAGERLFGPTPFPRHDVVLMPPTFVAGGMEHPMINFISPFGAVSGNHPATVEAKSLLAHEFAHSWAGDATTLATWDDVWLNEGITSYLTQRILEEMNTGDRVEFYYFLDRLNVENRAQFATDPRATLLHDRVDFPWNGFSNNSYTKGEIFLRTLEDLLGRTTLDNFLHDYFAKNKFHWTDDRNFIALLRDHVGSDRLTTAQVMEWIYFTGIPANCTVTRQSTLYNRVLSRVNNFLGGASINVQGWTETETLLFFQLLPANISRTRLAALDAALGMSLRETPTLAFLNLSILTGYTAANAAIERVLMHGGPNSWLPSIYATLLSVNGGRQRAMDIFARAKDRYEPNVRRQIEQMIAQSAGQAAA